MRMLRSVEGKEETAGPPISLEGGRVRERARCYGYRHVCVCIIQSIIYQDRGIVMTIERRSRGVYNEFIDYTTTTVVYDLPLTRVEEFR